MKWGKVFCHPDDREDLYEIVIGIACRVTYEPDEAFEKLYDFWEYKISRPLWELGFYADYLRCGHVVLEAANRLNRNNIEAQLLNEMGFCFMEKGMLEDSKRCFEKSLQLFSKIEDPLNLCRVNRYLAALFYRQGDYDTSSAYINKAEKILQLHGQPMDEKWLLHSSALNNLKGSICAKSGNMEALRYFEESFSIAEKFKENKEYYIVSSQRNIGKFYREIGRYEQAKNILEKTLLMCEKISRKDMIASVRIELSRLSKQKGKLKEALKHASIAAEVAGKEHPLERDKAVSLEIQITEKLGKRVK